MAQGILHKHSKVELLLNGRRENYSSHTHAKWLKPQKKVIFFESLATFVFALLYELVPGLIMSLSRITLCFRNATMSMDHSAENLIRWCHSSCYLVRDVSVVGLSVSEHAGMACLCPVLVCVHYVLFSKMV